MLKPRPKIKLPAFTNIVSLFFLPNAQLNSAHELSRTSSCITEASCCRKLQPCDDIPAYLSKPAVKAVLLWFRFQGTLQTLVAVEWRKSYSGDLVAARNLAQSHRNTPGSLDAHNSHVLPVICRVPDGGCSVTITVRIWIQICCDRLLR